MSRAGRVLGAAAAVLWMLAALTGIIWGTASDGALLAREMLTVAPPAATGLPEGEYPAVGTLTAAYLTGRTERFQHVFTDAAGQSLLCFQRHEEAHMADCRGLILLDSRLGIAFTAAALILTAAGLARGDRRAFGRGVLRGLEGLLIVATALGLWAAVNFSGLFWTFHRIAFTNDGWLLDPRRDLLIRLMPTAFFIRLGRRGLLQAAACGLLLAAAAYLTSRSGQRKEEERT